VVGYENIVDFFLPQNLQYLENRASRDKAAADH